MDIKKNITKDHHLATTMEDSYNPVSTTLKPRFTIGRNRKIPNIAKAQKKNGSEKSTEELNKSEISKQTSDSDSFYISSAYKLLPPISKDQPEIEEKENANEDWEGDEAWKVNKDERTTSRVDKREKNGPDSKWIRILDLHKNLPNDENKDSYLGQEEVSLLKEVLDGTDHHHHGYLPPKVLVQLCLSHIIVHNICVEPGNIRQAIHIARSQDIKMGLVNINRFLQALVDQFDTD